MPLPLFWSSGTMTSPFRLLLLGRSGVGKTYNGLAWVLTLLKDKRSGYTPQRTILVSQTWRSDPSQ